MGAANFSWRAGDWVHLRIEWDGSAALAAQQRILINGVEPTHTDSAVDYNPANLTNDNWFRIGSAVGNNNGSAGALGSIYDEVYSYGGYFGPPGWTTPAPLAHAGLTSSADEYLADSAPAKNIGLAWGGDATRRGVYLYLGFDSQFHGLNVALATAGTGVAAGALAWEFWNGTAWVDLQSGFRRR